MTLFLDSGIGSTNRTREGIAESCLVVTPNTSAEIVHGTLLAIAEGISERPDPLGASRDALATLGRSFYSTPENWNTEQALRESFTAANQAVLTQGEHHRATSLSAVVLRHRRWTVAHAGDTRVWLMRDHQLRLLTREHVTPRIGRRPLPHRACGLGDRLEPDIDSGELADGDILLLTNSGVHLAVNGVVIMGCLMNDTPAQGIAECLITRASTAQPRLVAAACLARVEKLPPETAADMAENIARLPVIAPPTPGTELDRFTIGTLLHKSRQFRLYEALDQESGSAVVLKFPNPRHAHDPAFADGFLREEWIGKQLDSPYLAKTLPIRAGRRSALYAMMAPQPGENLSDRLKRKGHLSVRESTRYAGQLLEALEQLHGQGIVHGDVRAKNISVDKQKQQIVLLGLGTTHVEPLGSMTQSPETPKTSVTHYAPELFAGEDKNRSTDVYAAGVTLYRMLTGRYPYGRISTRDEPPSGPMIPAHRHNSQVPAWLEHVLSRACALDPASRYRSASEFREALEESDHTTARTAKPATDSHHATTGRTLRRDWLWVAAAVAALAVYLFLTIRH